MAQLPTLKNGSKNEAVKGLKNALMAHLFDTTLFDRPLSEDFGPKTERAVKKFQGDAGLEVDGIVGPMTWGALGVHLVESGETLSGIAEKELGDPSRWPEIHRLNEELVTDPDSIFPGQILVLPFEGC